MTQKYVKSTQKLCDKLKEQSEGKYSYYKISDWVCGECGWNISYADDCVVTSTHDYWQNDVDHTCGYSGIYHTWCRKLCSWCNGRIGLNQDHVQCDLEIKKLEIEKRIASADKAMYNMLIKVK